MRPGIQAIVDETLSTLLKQEPPVDFVEKFALTVPSLVICQLLDVPAGEGVLVVVAAANRDASVFAEPDEFDIGRQARHHLAFGASIHQCIGHPLARAELQIVFDTLFGRVPSLRVAVPEEEISYKYQSLFFEVHALPVTW
jgi:cytochrome P450